MRRGAPRAADAAGDGRVYGFLLLRGDPSSSDELRSELLPSSGAVSTAIRELVSWGLARTIPQPASRPRLTDDARAAARLRDVTDLFAAYVDAGERVLRERSARER